MQALVFGAERAGGERRPGYAFDYYTRFGMAFCVPQKRMPKRNLSFDSYLGFRSAQVPLAPPPNSTPGYVIAPFHGAVLCFAQLYKTLPLIPYFCNCRYYGPNYEG
jgi:hypothetical protein